jgi:hypothetical protein
MGKSSRRGKRGEASQGRRLTVIRSPVRGSGLAGDSVSVAGEAVAAVRPSPVAGRPVPSAQPPIA